METELSLEAQKYLEQMALDEKNLTPEQMQTKYNFPKEYYEKYHAFGFEYEFHPHWLFRCNAVCWRVKNLHDVQFAFGIEQNESDVFDRCHAAVRRMIAFISRETKANSYESLLEGTLYKVKDDWIWIGNGCLGPNNCEFKIAFMSNNRERVTNDIKELFRAPYQSQSETSKQTS